MSNLLPKNEQAKFNKEYSLRRLSIIFFILSIVLIISFILLFPSYLLSRVRETTVSLDLESIKKVTNAANPNDDITNRLRDAKDKARALQITEKKLPVYDIFHSFQNKPRAIKLKDISYGKVGEDIVVSIQGRADTRESLTEFERQLKENPNFSGVNLPISNFAKEKNIDFSMNIVVKK